MSFAAIAFLSGAVAAFAVFAVALAYVTHSYQRYRDQAIAPGGAAPVPLHAVAQEQSLGTPSRRAS